LICPRCKTKASPGDNFCVECRFDLMSVAHEVVDKPAEQMPAKSVKPGETLLSHATIRDIAASHEYNRISPLSGMTIADKREGRSDFRLAREVLDAILNPTKAFYLTTSAGDRLSQEVLLVRNSTCYRWVDEAGSVLVSIEKNPREFINRIHSEISRGVSGAEKSTVLVSREQVLMLKAINSLCQVLTRVKSKGAFTTYDYLKVLLKSDEGLKGQLDELAAAGMVRIVGSDNFLVTLEAKGEEIVGMLENYDAYYALQVLVGGVDEFSSIQLMLKNGRLYMMSNPKNGDNLVVRTLSGSDVRSVLNWMWTADLHQANEAGETGSGPAKSSAILESNKS
jgi:hypothetical protein